MRVYRIVIVQMRPRRTPRTAVLVTPPPAPPTMVARRLLVGVGR